MSEQRPGAKRRKEGLTVVEVEGPSGLCFFVPENAEEKTLQISLFLRKRLGEPSRSPGFLDLNVSKGLLTKPSNIFITEMK